MVESEPIAVEQCAGASAPVTGETEEEDVVGHGRVAGW